MEILELILKSYGRFENHRIVLKPGINIIYGGNETGKTTIHSFIRAMFFGLNRSRGKAAKKDEYQIRQPWDAPGAFLGSMRIRENDEVYRIDRCFDRSAQPLAVVCETRAQESANPEQDLAALLGGISENAFVNTVFIPQAHCETDESFAEELRRFMVNSESTLDAELDVTQALQGLRKKKRQFEQKKKKEEEALEAQIAKKQEKAEIVREELERLRQQADRLDARGRGESCGAAGYGRGAGGNAGYDAAGYGRIAGGNAGYGGVASDGAAGYGRAAGDPAAEEGGIPGGRAAGAAYDSEWEEEEHWDEKASRRRIRLLELLLLTAGLLALAGAFLWEDLKLRIFLGVFGAVFLAMIFVVRVLFAERREPQETQPGLSPQEEQQLRYLTEEIRAREDQYGQLEDELEELYHSHVRLDGADTEAAALTLAIDRICELASGIYQESGGQLNERASQILREITGGRYDRIVLDESSEVRIHTRSRVLGLHQVSGGTMQQIYFALRMAAGELLCEGRALPVILDETFAMYDDDRLEAALRWLKASGRQVILFTCQRREREILQRV